MEFNSLSFLMFFVPLFVAYHLFGKNVKIQNIILLVASYVFYGIADLKMIPVIAVMTVAMFVRHTCL